MGIWANNTTDYSGFGATAERTFKDVPDGTYLCTVLSLELGESKRGMPMIKTTFQILEGEYANHRMWANKVVLRSLDKSTDDSFLIHMCNDYLESFRVIDAVKLDNLAQYEATVDYIAGQICSPIVAYQVEKVTRKDFADYHIIQGPIQLDTLEPVAEQAPAPAYPDMSQPVPAVPPVPPQSMAIPEPGAPLPNAPETGDDIPF